MALWVVASSSDELYLRHRPITCRSEPTFPVHPRIAPSCRFRYIRHRRNHSSPMGKGGTFDGRTRTGATRLTGRGRHCSGRPNGRQPEHRRRAARQADGAVRRQPACSRRAGRARRTPGPDRTEARRRDRRPWQRADHLRPATPHASRPAPYCTRCMRVPPRASRSASATSTARCATCCRRRPRMAWRKSARARRS